MEGDPIGFPYMVVCSRRTQAIFVLLLGFAGVDVRMGFLDAESARRFSEDFQDAVKSISPKVIQEADDILRDKQVGGA